MITAIAARSLFATQDQQPQFRSGIPLIQIDVTVLDDRGAHITGLSESDFRVLEHGVPQRVVSVAEVRLPASPGAPLAEFSDVQVLIPIPTSELLPGKYVLQIAISGGAQGRFQKRRVQFEVF